MATSGQSFSAWFDSKRDRNDVEAGVRNRDDGANNSSESSSFIPSIRIPSVFGGSPAPAPAPTAPSWCPAVLTNSLSSNACFGADGNCGLSFAQRIQIGLLLLAAAAFLLGMALFMFLPMVLIMPSKFASALSFGSILFMAATTCFSGIRSSLVSFTQTEKLPFVGAYLGSLLLTLYATYVSQSYFLIVIAVAVQIAALLWYAASFLPGGTSAMSFLSRGMLSATLGSARSAGASVLRLR